MAECTGCSGAHGPATASHGGNDGPSASDIASNLADASTGPNGLEPDRYAAHIDAAMDSVRAGAFPGIDPADIETAAMGHMNSREQGQFQRALDTYRASPFTSASQDIAMSAPFQRAYTDPYNAIGLNQQGQPINANGQVIADLPAQTFASSTTSFEYQFAMQERQRQQTALENIDRIRGGPISGLATSVAISLGADQRTIELVHGLGQTVDGLTTTLAPSPWEAMTPRSVLGR